MKKFAALLLRFIVLACTVFVPILSAKISEKYAASFNLTAQTVIIALLFIAAGVLLAVSVLKFPISGTGERICLLVLCLAALCVDILLAKSIGISYFAFFASAIYLVESLLSGKKKSE